VSINIKVAAVHSIPKKVKVEQSIYEKDSKKKVSSN
jgi:hypothetical protein